MSEIQETDIAMRIFAILGGIASLIEAILVMADIRLMPYDFDYTGGILSIIFAVLALILGIKPIHYTPTWLGILGVGLIICATLIGGIIVLLATLIGAIS